MVHTPGHNSKSSSVRKPGTKPPKPTIFQSKSKTKRPKSVRKPQNTLQNRLRSATITQRSSMVGRAEMASNAAKTRVPVSVRRDDQPSPGKPIGRQYENKARKRVAAANAANAPKKRVTPPADMRPKSKSSSVVKPTNEEARRTAQAKRLGAKPPVAPRVYENKAKKRFAEAAAKKASDKGYRQTGMDDSDMSKGKPSARSKAKIVTNAPVDMSGVKRMPDRSMADAGAKGWEALKKNIKGAWGAFTSDQARRRKDTQTRNAYKSTEMDDPVATKTKLPRVASIDQRVKPASKGASTRSAVKRGEQDYPSYESSQSAGVSPARKASKKAGSMRGYTQTGMDDVDMGTPKLSAKSASMTAKTEAEIAAATSVSKGKKAESVAKKVTPKAEVKVAESKYSYRGGQRPKGPINPTRTTKNPAAAKKAGDNMRVPDRIETGFEASMLRGMSKIFGGAKMSVPSGVEGTDSWSTLSVDSTGRVTRKRRKSNPRRNMGDQDN